MGVGLNGWGDVDYDCFGSYSFVFGVSFRFAWFPTVSRSTPRLFRFVSCRSVVSFRFRFGFVSVLFRVRFVPLGSVPFRFVFGVRFFFFYFSPTLRLISFLTY